MSDKKPKLDPRDDDSKDYWWFDYVFKRGPLHGRRMVMDRELHTQKPRYEYIYYELACSSVDPMEHVEQRSTDVYRHRYIAYPCRRQMRYRGYTVESP